jgi:voltage-gated potassium channel Kch
LHISPKRPFPQWRFLQLTIAIVAWMVFAPHLHTRWSGHLAMHVMLLDLILVTMWANPKWRTAGRVILGLWLMAVIASLGSVLDVLPEWEKIEKTLDVGFMAPVTAACSIGVLAFAFRAERPTIDGIFAMVVAYLLIAMVFTELFYLTLVWDPQAIHLLKPLEEMTVSELRGELLYFSMVTITTVGYGDVLAASPTARMLAIIEAVLGQFFVAVLVGMFVGMYASQLFENRGASTKGRRDLER